MDTTKTTTHLGLCAGYGGIELGLKRVIPNLRSVALCEIEAFACANLVAKMEAGLMEPAPIWTDLKSFPWAEFSGKVDILTGGYPCQPFSAAGKRLGTEDPRHLWPYIASGIRILQPRMCFFENVEGHISLGLREVIGELESIGYKVSWGIFSAREVGAPHQRKRVFIMAHSTDIRLPQFSDIRAGWRSVCTTENGSVLADSNKPRLERSIQQRGSRQEKQNELVTGCCGALADTNGARSWENWEPSQPRTNCVEQSLGDSRGSHQREIQQGTAWPSRPGEPQHGWEPPRVVGNSKCVLLPTAGEHGAMDEASGIPADGEGREPSQADSDASLARSGEVVANDHRQLARHGEQRPERTLRDLSGGCGEGRGQAMGNAAMFYGAGQARGQREAQTWRTGATQHDRQAQPALGGNPDGVADRMDYAELCVTCDNRTDELRLLGNGVVPATAERAFRTLLEELNT